MTLAVLETDGGGGDDDDATVFKRPEIRPRFVSLSSTCAARRFKKETRRNRSGDGSGV